MKNSVKTLRKTQGWSQDHLAEKLQVSRQTISAIENRRYDPSLTLAFSISTLFEMSIEDIFDPNES